jgi:uncharacterized protein (TIGR00661 family)
MKIIYGVSGEGMGHATRSSVVIDYLNKNGHEVHVYSSGRAYEFLSKKHDNVRTIKGFNLIYEGDALKNMRSMFSMLRNLPKEFNTTLKTLANHMYEFRPEVIISDFETFTNLIGIEAGIPVIAANNISITNRTKIDLRSLSQLYPMIMNQGAETVSNFRADYFVIPSFFFPEVKDKNVILTNPVVRESIQKLASTEVDHILVYQTSKTNMELLDFLERLEYNFRVYGYGRLPDRKNMVFSEFNEDQFLKDLASSRAVIAGGGFSLLSESIYLKKPVMSVPLRNHFEQITNAHYLEVCKFGEFHQKPTETDIRDFLLKKNLYQHYLNQYTFDPMEFPRTIEDLARKIGKEPKTARLRAVMALNLSFRRQ